MKNNYPFHKKLFLGILLSIFFFNLNGQSNYDKTSFGIGAGLNFGGIGGNFLVYPQKNIGLFAGGGYAFAGFGYNVGTKIRITSSSRIHPFFMGMYGYNAAIAVSNASQYNKLFYGPSLGFGIDLGKRDTGYWSMALLVPIRGSDVDDYINSLKNKGINFKNSLTPVTFSFGYHFVIN